MQFQFPLNSTTEMSFKVGIAGTQALPSTVSVVLERDGRSLSYNAVKTGDEWVARIDNPGASFSVGDIRLSISVLLNSRLFTPFKSVASIIEEMAPQAVEAPSESPPAQEPAPELPPIPASQLQPETPAPEAAPAPAVEVAVEAAVEEAIEEPKAAEPSEVPAKIEPKIVEVKAAKPIVKPVAREEIVKDIVKEVITSVVGPQAIKLGILKSIEPLKTEPQHVETTVIAPPVVESKPVFKLKKVRTLYR